MDEDALDEVKELVLSAIEPYSRVSDLHNYGSGLSRIEQAEIKTGTFILEDVKAVFDVIRARRNNG
jgi:hypothetical protein